MEFQSVVTKRKMVRSFKKKPIEQDKLDQIIENILSGPSAGYAQGTQLVILTKEEDRLKFFRQWGSDTERQSFRQKWPYLENAPVIILVCADEQRYRQRYSEPDKNGLSSNHVMPWWLIDAGMASLLGLLTVVDQDLVASFTGIRTQSYIQEKFGIPERITVIGAILIGYQKGEYRPSSSVKRGKRSIDEIVHYNQW